ncbi:MULTISPECIES: fructose-specific PTS transporter subunit EIIC [unclassified Lactobacillus]|uniref:fructose-specific PTS transporter subunit EIIC n=1 Tax=unclassified Lactobacillus TaxID=2620435 RepID=UPI000EFD2532|nr:MULTISPECIES: fructose-specific PTS transporter subunit EIIC [unclassified Lactobacillus]RMC41282.1 PTS fructose transporter subunit IIABC [Lactobacillus sp. ESL0237]RMC45151.1 PTS fructose transporter subunit IIABC [Lactobacillus sp. ESL0234]RMC45983.1 PTS fructose transporter subunit IIABC [Lactobacillus sp. ESL0236]RMC51664.1 PTS fructose transporter subunit IIABC [Lactobacillus sp. ESL0225]
MAKYDLVGATGCATGVAHTFMAEEALEKAAKKLGYTIKIETHGQTGVENHLTAEEIREAKAVIIASDIDVDTDRFAGKKLVVVPVAHGLKEPEELINRALNAPIYKEGQNSGNSDMISENNQSVGNKLYTSLMNGVSHMLPFVVAGGVLIAISFFWGINSADPKSSEYNQFAAMLNTVGSTTMNLMAPVLGAYIAEALAQRTGFVVGLAAGFITFNGGGGFLGAIVGGYLATIVVWGLQKLFKPLPDDKFRGLKSIFLFPVLGVLITGSIMYLLNTPIKAINVGMMTWLKGFENTNPILLGIIVGIMCASDFGGPINKAAYVTGTVLLAQGNYFFMAGVSAACIAPPLATGFAVLMNPKAYSKSEKTAGYVNFLLGSTHITEGAIPFAAKHPLWNIPAFMVGSAIAAVLTYITKISVPAPHGGFIVLPLVNKPLLWVLWIIIGSIISGVLLALIAGRFAKKDTVSAENSVITTSSKIKNGTSAINEETFDPSDILEIRNIKTDVDIPNRDEALKYLADFAVNNNLANDSKKVYASYANREQEGSTGMTDGFAIPHAQSAAIEKSAMLILKLKHPIDWQSLDGQKIDIVISFLIPQVDSNEHLKYLSNTAKLLTHEDFIAKLKIANTAQDIFNLFKNTKI